MRMFNNMKVYMIAMHGKRIAMQRSTVLSRYDFFVGAINFKHHIFKILVPMKKTSIMKTSEGTLDNFGTQNIGLIANCTWHLFHN